MKEEKNITVEEVKMREEMDKNHNNESEDESEKK